MCSYIYVRAKDRGNRVPMPVYAGAWNGALCPLRISGDCLGYLGSAVLRRFTLLHSNESEVSDYRVEEGGLGRV